MFLQRNLKKLAFTMYFEINCGLRIIDLWMYEGFTENWLSVSNE